MGKDLVPRFKCPLCGWLAYYSMLNNGPHKLEIRGMKYDGFQGISYHKLWRGKKEYKEFLCLKVRELAEELGLEIVGDEEVDDYEEDVEAEPLSVDDEEFDEIDLESLGLRSPASERVTEMPVERVESVPAEYVQSVQAPTGNIQVSVSDAFVETIDHEFVDLGGDDNG